MRLRLAFALLGLATIFQASLFASGSYPPNPPRLGGSMISKMDARAYNLGKTLFTDRLTLPEFAPDLTNPAANLARLSEVQNRLPDRVREEVDLPSLANRLDASQVDALLYYVSIRFRVSIDQAATPAS